MPARPAHVFRGDARRTVEKAKRELKQIFWWLDWPDEGPNRTGGGQPAENLVHSRSAVRPLPPVLLRNRRFSSNPRQAPGPHLLDLPAHALLVRQGHRSPLLSPNSLLEHGQV